ncbi:MAG TPA: hypothetical protein VLL54_15345 [Pyrinomonadaceae bacterium]|nr:hypothetical protein [Pyrinomonadaceae bacterium]
MLARDSIREATRTINKSINFITLAIFAPILILAGVAGFLVPAEKSLTSGAAPYNIFHIVFGVAGLLLVWSKKEASIVLFNITFGLIDLYQALASFAHLPPARYFRWTRVDDILHIVIGLILLEIGLYGWKKLRQR